MFLFTSYGDWAESLRGEVRMGACISYGRPDLVFTRKILEECYDHEQLWNWRMLITLHEREREARALHR